MVEVTAVRMDESTGCGQHTRDACFHSKGLLLVKTTAISGSLSQLIVRVGGRGMKGFGPTPRSPSHLLCILVKTSEQGVLRRV